MMDQFIAAFTSLMTPSIITWMLLGTAVGITFGAIPGLTTSVAITVFLPITYSLDIVTGLALIMAIFVGGVSGGLISAIMINIPGTPSSVATTFDGAPMAKKGEGGKALGTAVLFSFLATVLSVFCLIFIAPPLARMAIRFGPYEYFALMTCSLLLIAGLAGDNMPKGLTSALVGVVAGMVGMAPVDGAVRFTFGIRGLRAGLNIVPVCVGIFALLELLNAARRRVLFEKLVSPRIRGFGLSFAEFRGQIGNFFRSSAIGLGVGILPGVGAGTSNLLAYAVAKNSSKNPENFGKGEIAGIVAPESANNAGIGGALIPMLALGIPGDGITVIVLAAFRMTGIEAGPMFFIRFPHLANVIFAGLLIGSFMMLAMLLLGMRGFVKLLDIPLHYLLPVVIFICTLGAFTATNNVMNMWVFLVFGVIGYILNSFKCPLGPFIVAFVLIGQCEMYFRRGMQLSRGSFIPFMQSPIAGSIMAFGMIFLIVKCILGIRKIQRAAAARKAQSALK